MLLIVLFLSNLHPLVEMKMMEGPLFGENVRQMGVENSVPFSHQTLKKDIREKKKKEYPSRQKKKHKDLNQKAKNQTKKREKGEKKRGDSPPKVVFLKNVILFVFR